jgi:hypothetical protein
MRHGCLDHRYGDLSIDVLRLADLDTRLDPTRDVGDLDARWPGADMLTSGMGARRPCLDFEILGVDHAVTTTKSPPLWTAPTAIDPVPALRAASSRAMRASLSSIVNTPS